MKPNLKGCYNENKAICYFQEKGFEVFKKCQTNGIVDLITLNPKTGDVQCWDVKTGSYRSDGTKIARSRRDKNFKSLVRLLYVYDNGAVSEAITRSPNLDEFHRHNDPDTLYYENHKRSLGND